MKQVEVFQNLLFDLHYNSLNRYNLCFFLKSLLWDIFSGKETAPANSPEDLSMFLLVKFIGLYDKSLKFINKKGKLKI